MGDEVIDVAGIEDDRLASASDSYDHHHRFLSLPLILATDMSGTTCGFIRARAISVAPLAM